MALHEVNDKSGNTVKYKKYQDRYVPPTVPGDPHEHFQKVRNMSGRPGDVFIAAYPKCGTHWLWQIASYLTTGTTDAGREFIIVDMFDVAKTEAVRSPRVLATHLLYSELPTQFLQQNGKVIHVVRNPKDVAVSLYHFTKKIKFFDYTGQWDDFLQLFLDGKVIYSKWFDYVLSWEKASRENPEYPILCVYYEDLQQDCGPQVKRIAEFLEANTDDDFIAEIVKKCSFEVMLDEINKKNPERKSVSKDGSNPFLRKGEVGDWKNYFTVAQSEMFDAVFKERMKDSSYCFKFSI